VLPHSSEDLKKYGSTGEPTTELLPDEEADLEARLARVREEKRLALLDPGPSWKEWFYYRASKWYILLGFIIVLAWEVAYLFPAYGVPYYYVLPLIAATVYLQFLTYRYLWYRPKREGTSHSSREGRFRPTWLRPVPWGRWTPEAADARAGRPVILPEQGPDPREFL